MNTTLPRAFAYGLFSACVLAALFLHAIPALIAGLLAFILTRAILQRLRAFNSTGWVIGHEALAGLLVGAGSLALLAAIGVGAAHALAGESPSAMLMMLADTLQQVKHYLPEALASQAPDSLGELKEMLVHNLKAHANQLAGVGKSAVHGLVLTLVGWLVGVLAALHAVKPAGSTDELPAFEGAWFRLWTSMGDVFRNVAVAQAKIALLNASLTGVFLLLIMPLLGWPVPYAKTLVLATFLCGLLPVVGNLISNSLITIMALTVAFPAALTALAFLVISHKLEYLISARIQGHSLGASVWELLIALFAMETVFGPAGMVFAPIIYAFTKTELKHLGWLRS